MDVNITWHFLNVTKSLRFCFVLMEHYFTVAVVKVLKDLNCQNVSHANKYFFFLRKSKYYSFIRFNSSDHQTNYFLSTKLLISFLLFFAFSVKFGRKVQYVNYLHEVSNKSFNTQSIIIVKQFQFNYYLCFYYYLLLYFNRFN